VFSRRVDLVAAARAADLRRAVRLRGARLLLRTPFPAAARDAGLATGLRRIAGFVRFVDLPDRVLFFAMRSSDTPFIAPLLRRS
jgi:hypothetical protein